MSTPPPPTITTSSTPPATPAAQVSPLIYITWFTLFVCATGTSVWGQYVTLKFPNLGMIGSYKMAMPFVWITWIFMSIAIHLSHTYTIVSPTQTILLVTVLQFAFLLMTNHFYLHQPLFVSDIFAFFIIIFAFYVSYENLLSKALNRPVPTPSPTPSATPSTTPSTTPSSSSSPNEGFMGLTGQQGFTGQRGFNKSHQHYGTVGARHEDIHI